MTININSPGGNSQGITLKTDPAKSRTADSSPKATVNTGAVKPQGDKVTLTGQAEQLQKIDQMLKDTPDVDSQRVAEIKASIAAGTFKIDSAATTGRY